MNKRVLKTELTEDFPALRKLAEIHGSTVAAGMLGLSDIGPYLRSDRGCRPAYEMAAKLLLIEQGEIKKIKARTVVLKLATSEQDAAIMAMVNALKIENMELDL